MTSPLAIAARVALLAAALVVWVGAVRIGGDDPNPYTAQAATAGDAVLVQGKDAEWWARRAVQARKDANARAQTVAALRHALRSRVRIGTSGLAGAFECIHRFEGAWNDQRNSRYRGGLQMDTSFEWTYGAPFARAWGRSDRWPPFVQITVAMGAYLSGRGFSPWPSTSRRCGLR